MLVGRRRWRLRGAPVLLLGLVVGCDSDPGYNGRSSDIWIATLQHGTPTERADAAFALRRVLEMKPKSRKVSRALVGALRDTTDEVRLAAATAIRAAGRNAAGAVPLLSELLADSAHVEVRERAVSVLGDIGRGSPDEATEVLRRGLHDRSPEVRATSAQSLGRLREDGMAALPDLMAAARDSAAIVRLAAVEALSGTGTASDSVIRALAAALADETAAVRKAAALGLARTSPTDVAVVDALTHAVRDQSAAVRVAALYALGMIGDSTANSSLRHGLVDPDSTVREEAAHALSGFHRRGGRDPVLPEP